jgi:hypothetical protein
MSCAVCALLITLFTAAIFAQGARGKADLKSPGGSITVDYGRPSLQGRDMLSRLALGSYWRLGKDEVTLFTTPLDLAFGAAKIPKGSYSLWLKKSAAEKYELVFNRQVTGHGMVHDAEKDVAGVPMSRAALPNPVETLTIELQPAPGGGTLAVSWSSSSLATGFKYTK